MVRPEDIQTYIQEGLPCDHIRIDGDGHHFEAVIVSAEFAGKSRVQRQQRVYQTIKDRLDSGEIHALSFKTFTPEEWEAQRG
ncbi:MULTISPECIES: BolA family protein [Azospira]|jgi:acid stress-induced BolA-like protein IbaG/YrbA|uniref:BolA protein family transcriptional regulator n=2 Tax=Azospira oryzae TaxID=146939 RepID=A0ABY0INI4_9RHOO|nr:MULTISPECIES: BolA family protein [Azospira]TLS19437.1 MAG: BolA family transcriptional regulator [Betaproteobacteria bacterium]AEV25801.1 putative transcriptional regulator, BolA superfamily [Azospira oryzae PS]MBP7489724.1 BolA family transcriptional regulator [Azospira sp.]MDK9690747.1 BolA family transcriptional regulator [Azospira sp.]RZT75903.1 BolA protein family transcriptional regulator [Azospira oryzae]